MSASCKNISGYVPKYRHIEAFTVAEVCRKYSSVTLSGEKIGSRLECHSLRSARVMASWANQEGKVDPSAEIRPGFVKFFVVNTIRFEYNQYKKHVFACMYWYKEGHKRSFTVAQLRFGGLKVSPKQDLQPLCQFKGAFVCCE